MVARMGFARFLGEGSISNEKSGPLSIA